MDAKVQTGQTKAQDGALLLSKSLTTQSGEQVSLLLQISAESSAAKTFQKECLSIVQQSLAETEGDTSERLDSALKELNGLIKGLLLSKTLEDVHAIIAVCTPDEALHVSHAGRAEAYVVRGGTASQITEYTRGKPSPAFVHIASGKIEARDIVVLSTQRLLRTVTPAQLAQLAGKTSGLIDELKRALQAEQEQAALATLHIGGSDVEQVAAPPPVVTGRKARTRRSGGGGGNALVERVTTFFTGLAERGKQATSKARDRAKDAGWLQSVREKAETFYKNLWDPKKKKKAHLLLMAGVVAIFLIIWAIANLTAFTQQSQTKAELEQLVQQINEEIRTAENRRLTGDIDSANAILQRSEERAKQVLNNESGHFRAEALDLVSRIRTKREEVNNIIRLSPRVLVNLGARKPTVKALGFLGLPDEEFIAYDRQDLYRVIHNNVEEPDNLSEDELILDGVHFERYQTHVFFTKGNSVIELINGQPTSMKTEDPAGWITGKDVEAYLRYLYVLSPENNQIYKYERLANRYASPDEYNVNGELDRALDIAIDGNVYVLKEDGLIVKLLRGEVQPFTIRHMPADALKNATKVFKVFDGNLYFLDPMQSRVVIVTDGGPTGESSYVKQYVLEGDEIGELKDLFVDEEESRLYVMDEKRIYKVDLGTK